MARTSTKTNPPGIDTEAGLIDSLETGADNQSESTAGGNGQAHKPQTYSALDQLPTALTPLTNLRRWVVWKWELTEKGKWTKEPYQAAHPQQHAKSNDTGTWGNYSTAIAVYRDKRNEADGIGLMLFEGDIAALDLDKCRNADSDELSDWAQKCVDEAQRLGAYVEVTVSGTGLRVIGIGKDGKVQRKFSKVDGDSSVEVYRKCERYITISGMELGSCSKLPNIDALIDATVKKYDKSESESASAPDNDDEPEKLSDEAYQELLEHGTIDGEEPEHRGREFQRLVWHLAAQGKTLADIVALLRQYPKGVAAKYLKPSDRLQPEAKRSFDKYLKHVPAVIAKWNKNHAHVLAGSKSCVLQEFKTPEGYTDFKLLSSACFKEWNAEFKFVSGVDQDGKPIIKLESKYWLAHRKRRKYQDIGFSPNREVSGFYNLWRGFAVEPRKGDCSKFLAHLHDNICQGDDELFAWVEAWFADIFQHPGVKCGTSLAMRGKMGVGKTKVGEVFDSLLGVHYKQVSDPRYVTGRFNSHMISLLLLFADEGFWAGDKKAEGKLKDLVTGKKHPIEYKGKEAFWVDNYVRLLVSGNEDWVVPAGFEERRFATIDVGDAHRNDYPYFAAIDKEMNEGGREALLHHLLFEVDCSRVNLRQIPHTDALVDQKLQSVTTEQGWWLDILRNGILPGDWDGNGSAPSELLFDSYIEHAKKKGMPRRAIETQVGMFLNKMAGNELRRSKQTWLMPEPSNSNCIREQRRGHVYQFPALTFCRERFAELFDEKMEWDEGADWTPDGNVNEEEKDGSNFKPSDGYLLLVQEFILSRFKQAGKNRLPAEDIMTASEARNIPHYGLYEAAKALGIEPGEANWVLPKQGKN